MPAAGSLIALMKEWPLNSAMLSTATHSKLREALDRIDTQVATCTIDKWTVKMKGAEEYIIRKISWRGGRQFGRHQKALVVQYQRRRRKTPPRTRPEDGFWPPPTTPLTILLPNDPARPLTKSSQRLSSWARFSTKFIVLGLLGLGLLTSTVKDTPQIGTLQLAPSVVRTCVLVRTIIEQGRAKPLRGNDDGQPIRPQMENCQEVPSSTGVWRHVRGPRPHQGPDESWTSQAAPVGPRWRKTAAARNAFKGLRGGNSFWRSVLVPSNSLEQSNGAVAWANP